MPQPETDRCTGHRIQCGGYCLCQGERHPRLQRAKLRRLLRQPVCHCPDAGACLHIGHHDRTVHEGKWQNGEEWCYWDYPLIEVAGKTYGLLGCGRIGIHTAEAAKALGMHVIAYDRYPSQAAERPWAWSSWSWTTCLPAPMCWASRCL